jgi:hypothetical protein
MGAWITVIHQIGSASAAHLAGLLRIDCGTYVDVSDTSCGRPFNGVLDPQTASNVDSDPIAQRHGTTLRKIPNPITLRGGRQADA